MSNLINDFRKALWIENKNISANITSDIQADFYAFSGVDIESGDSFSSVAGKVCKESYKNNPFVVVEDLSKWNFRWPRWFRYVNLPEWCVSTLAPDGVGTKPILYETLAEEGGFKNAAYDIVAMTADDIARYGWLATVFTSILDTKNIAWREKEYISMLEELWKIAKKQNFVILNGETAELPDCVYSPNKFAKTAFNWAASMSWIYHPDKMITWEKLEAWDLLVALKQDGFRSNGISWVRKAFELEYGKDYYKTAPKEELLQASAPSISYAKAIAQAHGWYDKWFKAQVEITWIAHLSWWSFKWKLLEDLLGIKWFSAKFNNLYPIPDIAKKVAIWSQKWEKPIKSIEEIYSTWCAGQWMIVAVRTQKDAEKLIDIMKENDIEAQIAWVVEKTPSWQKPSIEIVNIR